jgi:energy-coupling factor transport system permease protein
VIARTSFFMPGDSWLHRLDPRVKLWFALAVVALSLAASDLALLAGVLLATQAALLLGRVPPGRLGRVWLSLTPLLLVILILQPLLASGGVAQRVWQIGPLRLTDAGLLSGARYALRLSAAAFAAALPVFTTPVSALVRALQKMGLPYRWGMVIGLALRYLATLRDQYTTISEAQQARGWDPAAGGLIRRVRATTPTLIALIVASLRLGDALALGLAARGFGAHSAARRTYLHDISMRPADWIALAAISAAFAGALLLALR